MATPALEKERKSFDEVDEKEQMSRFSDIISLFDEQKGKEQRAKYFDFFKNVYKYTDRFTVEGMDKKRIDELFSGAKDGNEIIKDSLEFFLEVKKGDKKRWSAALDGLNKTIDECHRGIYADSKNRQLDVDKLGKLFRWSVDSFIKGGEKIGRKPKVKNQEIEPMAQDLEVILGHVNRTR